MGKKVFLLFLVIFVFLTPLVAENSPYPLKDWEFFWEDFITFGSTENPDGTISIPQSWEKITKQITGKSTNKGYCSYRKVLSNLDPNEEYAILINESPASACTLFINGEEYYSVGTVSTSKEAYKPYISPIYVYFNADQEGKAEIIFHISNFEQKKGGFSTSVFFGNKTEIFKYYIMQNGVSWLVVGTLIILSCFNILLFFRKNAPDYAKKTGIKPIYACHFIRLVLQFGHLNEIITALSILGSAFAFTTSDLTTTLSALIPYFSESSLTMYFPLASLRY